MSDEHANSNPGSNDDNLLKTDDALQALMAELSTFKSASENLLRAENDVEQMLQSVTNLVERTIDVANTGRRQSEKVTALTRRTEERITRLVENQRTLATAMEESQRATNQTLDTIVQTQQSLEKNLEDNAQTLQSVAETLAEAMQSLQSVNHVQQIEILPQLGKAQERVQVNRRLLWIVLAVLIINIALSIYLLWPPSFFPA